jgi:hypothetical protein
LCFGRIALSNCDSAGRVAPTMSFLRSRISRFAIPPFLGLLTGMVVGAIEVLFYKEDAGFLRMTFFFVIPIGGFLLGFLCSIGVCLGLWLTSQRPRFGHYFYCVVLSLASITTAYYCIYKGTFVDEAMRFNNKGKGKPLIEFVMRDTNEPIEFPTFLALLAEAQDTDVVIKVGHSAPIKVAEGVRIPRGIAELQFGLSWLGVATGSLLSLIVLSKEIEAGLVTVT